MLLLKLYFINELATNFLITATTNAKMQQKKQKQKNNNNATFRNVSQQQ